MVASTMPAHAARSVAVSVVIPSLQGGASLIYLATGLLRASAVEVVVVDNGLHGDTVAAVRTAGASVVSMGRNAGFGAAVNRGAAEATGEALVVLNDDVVPEEGFLGALTAPLTDFEMVAGVLLRSDRPDLVESAGIQIDRVLGAHDYLQNEPVSRLRDSLPPPVGPCGGAAAYRRSAFLAAGGFDSGFFAYYEDLDLALRLRAGGARCALAVDARALHAGSSTVGYGSVEKARIVGFSRGYLLRKHRVLARPDRAVAAVAVELGASLVLARRHQSLEPARARIRGWRAARGSYDVPAALVTVPVLGGLRRRYRRSSRTEGPR